MSFRKLGIAVVLSSAFAFIACGDDSSSSSSETVITCNIVSEDPLVLSTNEDGIKSTSTIELKDKRLVETVKFDSNDHIPDSVFNEIFKQACDTYKQDPDYNDTTLSCSGKTITAVSRVEWTESEFKSIENSFKKKCDQYTDKSSSSSASEL
jgi:hypothetical protein